MTFAPGFLSVIIPTFNAEAYLAETLESVLRQNWEPLEILVVDDGSSDRSMAVAENFGHRVRIIACPHRGLAATRNSGIAAARGGFLLHLDADDLLTPNSISVRMAILLAEPQLDMVVGKLECFVSPEIPADECARYVLPPAPQLGHLPGAAIIRASTFLKFGVLNEDFVVNADLDWSVRVKDEGANICQLDDVVVKRRIHGNNLTIVHNQELDTTRLTIMRASLARRRKAGMDGTLVEHR
ncbi:MAG: glycosyltransferase [Hydrogenophilales bacterium]|nr:glycosyltransferase [Hydrogenophilales bacterium]